MVREEDPVAILFTRSTCEEAVARLAGSGFDGTACGDFHTLNDFREPQHVRVSADKLRILSAGGPQTVIEMADDELSATAVEQPVKQRHRIPPAGDRDEIFLRAVRELRSGERIAHW